MAVFAILQRRFVVEDLFTLEILEQLVTAAAAHILVSARECELRPLVVIESRGLPLGRVVAVGARSDVCLGKLAAVRISVALLALERRVTELRIEKFRAEVRRLVAVNASHRAMCAHQGELGLVVVESSQILPCLGAVASFASERRAVGAAHFHPFSKLIVVRIFVAG